MAHQALNPPGFLGAGLGGTDHGYRQAIAAQNSHSNYGAGLANQGAGAIVPISQAQLAAEIQAAAFAAHVAGLARARKDAHQAIPASGIEAGEIIAWRCWHWVNGYLRSMMMDAVWLPGAPMTGDVLDAGVHAWKTKDNALCYATHATSLVGCTVVGSVKLWGVVVEHECGYRAEFAKIASVDLAPCQWRPQSLLSAIRKQYQLEEHELP